ncbi:MAG: glycosyltransferase family 4 protein [Candidatus Delongbacteria bacterium]|nr:glycosyltransferase family 4 protein [Candidatus Delongbacteria bacterium]
MNILFLNSKKSWAGVVSWKTTLAKNLISKGHNCFIVTGRNSALAKNKPDDLELHTIKFGMNYNPWTLFFFIKFIRKHKIDIIVTNIKKEVIFGGIAGKLTGVTVVRRIGNEKDFKSGKFLDSNFVDHFLFPCDYTRKLAINKIKWLDPKKTKVIHTGKIIPEFSDAEIADKRESWGAKKDDIVIGISDRLDKNKGIDLLIKVFASLSQKYDNIKLVITGKGSFGTQLEELVDELNIRERVLFAGFVTDVMLTARSYDLAVLASYLESFPNSVIEYMASNTAVICTDVGGVSELVYNGSNGFLIPKQNENELRSALEKLITNKNLRQSFAINALDTIKKGFTEDKMADKVIEFFNEIKR